MVLRLMLGAAAAALFVVSGLAESHAGFRVCNKSSEKIDVAIGYNSKDYGWTSEGWWSIAPNGCHDIITGRLNNRYYYVYAADARDGVWEAPKEQEGGFFCVAKAKFTFHNREYEKDRILDCEKGSGITKHFLSVDTQDADDFTYNLTE
jgi:uncharacterized membrane protein